MTTDLDRRSFVQTGSALAAGAAATAAIWPISAAAQMPSLAPSGGKPMKFDVKPMPFDPKKIKGLSEKLLVSHYENNYTGAVKRLAAISEQLAGLDYAKAPGFLINGLKREELIATNSMLLHEVYFDGLAGPSEGGGGEPKGALADAIARDFGSLAKWRAEFVAMGKALGGGSGWVLLTRSPRDGTLSNVWCADHTHSLAGGTPILALDMYEHSYHIDFGANVGAYVDAFMENLYWPRIARRFAGEAAPANPHLIDTPAAKAMLDANEIVEIQTLVRAMPVSEEVVRFAVKLVSRSRPEDPQAPKYVREYVRWGASPRGLQTLVLAGRIRALLDGRYNLAVEDLEAVVAPALRHRIFLNFEADAAGVTADQVVASVVQAQHAHHR